MDEEKRLIRSNARCSPKSHGKGEMCLTVKEMHQIAKDAKVPIVKDKKKLTDLLNSKLNCQDDKCWVDILGKTALKANFRPDVPSVWAEKPTQWLSNFDISKVMVQYTEKYKQFAFLGVAPLDFSSSNVCGVYRLCDFNLFDLLASGKKEFGIVINLDKFGNGGSHWVALYCSCKPKSKMFGMCYYDSCGFPPKKETRDFIVKVKKEAGLFFRDKMVDFDKRFVTMYNTRQHQKKHSECGMFSMVFLISCLERKDYASVCEEMSVGSDDLINAHRKLLFYVK
jgi:hypothetical protein